MAETNGAGQTLRDLIEALRREMNTGFESIKRELDQRHQEFREKQSEMQTRLLTLENWRVEFTEKAAEQHTRRDRASLSLWQGIALSILTMIVSYLVNHFSH